MINFFTQLPGYLAFLFLAISFILYGILIHAFPIVLTNAVLLIINIYFLIKIYRRQEKFDLVEFTKDAALIPEFMSFYKKDINLYFPGFIMEDKEEEIKFVVLRDIVIANIFVAAVDDKGNAFVKINYTVPKYRDYKVGRFLFDEGKTFLQSKGIKKLIYKEVSNGNHEKFIKAMGFKKEPHINRDCYVKIM